MERIVRLCSDMKTWPGATLLFPWLFISEITTCYFVYQRPIGIFNMIVIMVMFWRALSHPLSLLIETLHSHAIFMDIFVW